MSNQKRESRQLKVRLSNSSDSLRSVKSYLVRNNVNWLPSDFLPRINATLKNITSCMETLGEIEKHSKNQEKEIKQEDKKTRRQEDKKKDR